MPSVVSTWLRDALKEPLEPFETLHVQITNQKPVVALNGDQIDNLRAKIQTRLYIHTDIKSWDKNCSVREQKRPTTCIRQNAEILSSM